MPDANPCHEPKINVNEGICPINLSVKGRTPVNLSAADTTFEAFFSNSFDAAFVLDHDCVFRKMNRAAAELLGCQPNELIGQPLASVLPPEIEPAHGGIVARYLQARGPSAVLDQVRSFAVIDRSGERIPVELKAFELDKNSPVASFGAVMVDLRGKLLLEAERDATMARLAKLAQTDELTSLPNRRAFLAALKRAKASAQRGSHAASVAMLDIDLFKHVNDTLGHSAGDAVLAGMSQVVQGQLRDSDLVGRVGGEEFGLLLDYSSPGGARTAAERIRQAVADTVYDTGKTGPVRVTVSIGIAPLTGNEPVDASLMCADKALYLAKENGRNRVELGKF